MSGPNGAVYNQEVGNQLGFWTADAQSAHSPEAAPGAPHSGRPGAATHE